MASYDEALVYILKSFGVSELKMEQKVILDALMESKDCVGILPTGYGKSLPYQLVLPLKRALKTDSSGDKNNRVLSTRCDYARPSKAFEYNPRSYCCIQR